MRELSNIARGRLPRVSTLFPPRRSADARGQSSPVDFIVNCNRFCDVAGNGTQAEIQSGSLDTREGEIKHGALGSPSRDEVLGRFRRLVLTEVPRGAIRALRSGTAMSEWLPEN